VRREGVSSFSFSDARPISFEIKAGFLMNKAFILRTIPRDSKGLSLLEVLIAIIILALSLTSISYFFSTARGNIEATGHMRCGLALAQDKMEELKDLGYSAPDLSEGTHSDRVNSIGKAAADGKFYREWTITVKYDSADGAGAGDPDYKLVELKVFDQWLNRGNETLNDDDKLVAELKTYISP
jgi:prepilin-type N-terminal cleavage/methylation domain-containing protein